MGRLGVLLRHEIVDPGVLLFDKVGRLGVLLRHEIVDPGILLFDKVGRLRVLLRHEIVDPGVLLRHEIVYPGILLRHKIVYPGVLFLDKVGRLGILLCHEIVYLSVLLLDKVSRLSILLRHEIVHLGVLLRHEIVLSLDKKVLQVGLPHQDFVFQCCQAGLQVGFCRYLVGVDCRHGERLPGGRVLSLWRIKGISWLRIAIKVLYGDIPVSPRCAAWKPKRSFQESSGQGGSRRLLTGFQKSA